MTRFISIVSATLLGTGACGSVSPSSTGEDACSLEGSCADEDPCSLDGSCADAGAGLSLSINESIVEGRVGDTATIAFTVAAGDGFDGEITVTALDLPVGFTVGDVVLPRGASDGALSLSIPGSALAGISHSIVLEANAGAESATGATELFVVGRPGTPDVTFGDVGRVSLARPLGFNFASALVASDESIVVAGTINESLAVWKLTALGDPDPSFGVGGLAEVSFADLEMPVIGGGQVAIQSDGAIVVAGHGIAALGSARNALLVARVTSSGALDPSFGDGGRVSQTFGARGFSTRALAIGPDDSLNIAGCAVDEGFGSDRGVVRLLRDGELDGSFGSGGLFVQPTTSLACLGDIQVRDDGSIVAIDSGAAISIGANGSLDVLFGVDGVSTFDTIAAGFDLASDGSILVGGTDRFDILSIGRPTMTRIASDGIVDPSFGALVPVFENGRVHFVHAGPAGILAVIKFGIFGDAAVARLRASGELDSSFADGGLIRLTGSGAMLNSVELEHSRLLVVTSSSLFRIWR